MTCMNNTTQTENLNKSLILQASIFHGDISLTTIEIAELTGKRRDNVLRDTKGMLIEVHGKNNLLNFEEVYTTAKNQTYPCYRLPKDEVIVLISGYSIKLRMKIVKRLRELEEKTKDPIAVLNNPAALRQALLTYTEKVIALEETVQAQAPKLAALDRIATADGSMCITDAAKHLQVRPKDLFGYLVENKWIYRRQGKKSYLAYQTRIQQGVMEHKVTTQINCDGVERVYEQARVTPKGIAKLAEVFEKALI